MGWLTFAYLNYVRRFMTLPNKRNFIIFYELQIAYSQKIFRFFQRNALIYIELFLFETGFPRI